jgi:hypothetical protein
MKQKTFYYLVDKLNENNAGALKAALQSISGIESITIRPSENLVEIIAPKKMDEQIKVACSAVGLVYRTRAKSRR